MEIHEIKPIHREVRKDNLYPFDKLAVHQGFFIDDPSKFKIVRVQASKFNKRSGRMIRCNLVDAGRMQVWRDVDPSDVTVGIVSATAEPSADDSAVNPTKKQFQSYLRLMKVGQSFQLNDASRFEQFERWIDETQGQFSALQLEPGVLTVVRLPDVQPEGSTNESE